MAFSTCRHSPSASAFWGIVAIAAGLSLSACKKNEPPKAPVGTKKGAEANPDEEEPWNDEEEEEVGPSDSLGIAPASSGQSWSFPTGQPISIEFSLTGADSGQIEVGLKDKPAGATMTRSGSTVTVTWSSPTVGKHPISFVLRDMEICEEEEGSASKCALSDPPKVDSAYDISSNSWELDISAGTTVGGTGTGTGTGAGAGAGGNAALIQQITGLLGGGGDISGLLQGLGAGDLQTILQGAQNGNLDITSLLSQLGG